MYLRYQYPVNPKFSLCQLPVKANSKYKSKDAIFRRSVLPSGVTP